MINESHLWRPWAETAALPPAVLFFVYLALQLVEKCKVGAFYRLEEPADSTRNAIPETVKHGPR